METEKVECPECGAGEKRVVFKEETWRFESGSTWCHSVKLHDDDADAMCLECEWEGQRSDAVTTIINKEYVYYREDDKFPAFLRHENGDEEWVADFVKESLAKKFVKAANKDLK